MAERSAFSVRSTRPRVLLPQNYEILWEDTSPEGVAWVEEEFDAFWKDAYPLPDAIVEEIKRVADRVEIRFEDAKVDELPAAALAESPIYRGGETTPALAAFFCNYVHAAPGNLRQGAVAARR